MTAPHAELVISDILRREGSRFTDDPVDRGGATRWGVTLKTLREFHKNPGLKADAVEALTEDQARVVFRWYLQDLEAISHPAVYALVADSAVNHGRARAASWLQQAMGVDADGVIGPVTKATLAICDYGVVYRRFLGIRAEYYGAIVSRDPSQARFILGWLRRLREFIERTP